MQRGERGRRERGRGVEQERRDGDVARGGRRLAAALAEPRGERFDVAPSPGPLRDHAPEVFRDRLGAEHAPVDQRAMTEGDIAGVAVAEREGETHRRRAQHVVSPADGDHDHARRRGDPREQRRQRGLVARDLDGRRRHLGARTGRRLAGRPRGVVRPLAVVGLEVGEQASELEPAEESAQRFAIRLPTCQSVRPEGKRDVFLQRSEPLGEPRLLRLFAQCVARARLRDLVGVRQQVLEIAPFGDQLRGAFVADAPHARNVVAGIADQRPHVEHTLRRDPEALRHLGGSVAAILHRV